MAYHRKDNVIVRRIAGEVLLVPLKDRLADLQRLFVLEGTGEFIWELLDGQHSNDEICERLTERFDVGKSKASADLREFVGELRKRGLVEES